MDKQWIGKNEKAIAPIRVSSMGQEGNTSWITQKRECEEYCLYHGLDLVETVQIVETASKPQQRKKYHEVIQRALRDDVQHVIFHRYDREARNLTDNENNEELVRLGKIILHYVAEGRVLSKVSPDSDFLMRDYHAVQNKHYSRDLSTKVKRAALEKARQGWWPGCRPPDGYIQTKVKSEKGFERRRGSVIVLDTNELTLRRVRREFELRAQRPTSSWKEIRNQIIREGLIPVEMIKKYYPGSIERRLTNVFYDCRFVWNGVEFTGNHERIISQELFWRVQETVGIKNPYRKNSSGLFGHGWITCADPACGCVVTYDPKTKTIISTGEEKTYHYYRCSNGKRAHQKHKSVSQESIMLQLESVLGVISIQDDFHDELLKAINENAVKARNSAVDEIEKYSSAIESLCEKEHQAYDLFAEGSIDLDVYQIQRKRIQEQRVHFSRLIKQAEATKSDSATETVHSIIELANNAKSLWNHMDDTERHKFLDKVLYNRQLDGVSIRYEIIKPLRMLSEMKENRNWRRERDSNSR